MSETLFEGYVRGTLSDAERDELIRLLGTETGARQFGDFIREWSLLSDVSKRLTPGVPFPLAPLTRDGAPAGVRAVSRSDLDRVRLRRWRAGAVAAVVAGVIVGVVAALRSVSRPPATAVPAEGPAPVAIADAGGPEPTEAREGEVARDEEAAAAAKVSLDRYERSPSTDPRNLLAGGDVPPAVHEVPAVPEAHATAMDPPPAAAPVPGLVAPSDNAVAAAPPRPASAVPASPRSQTSVARIDVVQGDVGLLAAAGSGAATPARAGQVLYDGQGLQTAGRDARAVVVFGDATRLEIGSDTVLRRITDGRPAAAQDPATGKGAFLEHGVLTAVVNAQPTDRPLVLMTSHAEARVQGTRLSLTVSRAATRLDVQQGRVRFTRRSDGAAVELSAGQYAATDPMGAAMLRLREHAKGTDVVRLLDDFEGPLRWYHPDSSAPLEFLASPELFHSPRLSLLVSFRPKKESPDDHALLVHPLRLRAGDRFLRFHVRVAELAGRPEWSVSLREKDDDRWHLGSGAFEHLRGAKGWNVLEVPLPDGSSDFVRHGDGDGRFDPAAVEALSLSIGGGRVVFFLDTLLAVEDSGREVPFPTKPSRAGGQ
jgi:hypothetical protein